MKEKEAGGPWSLAGSADCLLFKDRKYIWFTIEPRLSNSAWNTVGSQQMFIEQMRNMCSKMAGVVYSEKRRVPETEFTCLTNFPKPGPAEDCRAMVDVGVCGISFYEVFKNKIGSHLSGRVPMKNKQ